MATSARECAVPRCPVRAFRVIPEAQHEFCPLGKLDQALALSTVYVDAGPGD